MTPSPIPAQGRRSLRGLILRPVVASCGGSLAVMPRRRVGIEGVRIPAWVKPGAPRTAVGGRHGYTLVVSVTERAVEGRATEAALQAVADAFAVPRSSVTLLSGASSRNKIMHVAGPPGSLTRRLAELLGR